MKYLFIFLPFFAFGQGDTLLYGTRTDIDSFRKASHPDTCWEIKDGWMSLKPGCAVNASGAVINFREVSVLRWSEPKWIRCDQHIGSRDMPKRDKIDRTKAKILVWNGCALEEIEVYKITHYNEMTVAKDVGNLAVYISGTIRVDIAVEYLYDGGWIKNSHVIKEL